MKKLFTAVFVMLIALCLASPALAKPNFMDAFLRSTDPWQAGTPGQVSIEVETTIPGTVYVSPITNDCNDQVIIPDPNGYPVLRNDPQVFIFNHTLANNTLPALCVFEATATLVNPGGKVMSTMTMTKTLRVLPPAQPFPTLEVSVVDDTVTAGSALYVRITITNNTASPVNVTVVTQWIKAASIVRNWSVVESSFTNNYSACFRSSCNFNWDTIAGYHPLELAESVTFLIKGDIYQYAQLGYWEMGLVTLNPGNTSTRVGFHTVP